MADITYTQLQAYECSVNSGRTALDGFALAVGANTIHYRSHATYVINNIHATVEATVVFSANKNTDGTQIPVEDRTFVIAAGDYAVVGPLDPSFETAGKVTITVSGAGATVKLVPCLFLLN
jgi:hypothetical protein